MGLVLCALWTALGHVEAEVPLEDPQAVLLSEMAEIGGFQWSPDGRQIAYLSNESGTSQIHILSVADGVSRQLTRHKHPVWDPQWSPDGARLLFLSDPGWQERNEVWEVRLGDAATSRILPNGGAVVRNARWSRDGSAVLLETNASGQFDLAIWRRTDAVLRPFFKESAVRSEAQWSPDGKSLAYLSAGAVWIAGADGEKPRRVVTPGLGAGLRGLRWSPDGQSILFITDLHGDWDVGVYSLPSNEWLLITSDPWEDLDASWSSDGRRVAFVSTQQFDKRLGIFDVASRKVDYISREGSVASSPLWSPVNQVLAYVSSTPRQPRQLWQFANGTHRELTRLPERHAKAGLATPESHAYPGREGLPVPALLYKPADFRPGTRYPAIMVIHGGFDGQWVNDFDAIGQFLLHKGYVLLYPNPRGSGGYGRTYERLNDGDWGGGDTDDLLRGHDYLAGLPFVDSARIGLWGGSYGGYLVYSLLTQAPGRFQAAIVRAGISDLRWQVQERRGSPVRLNNPLTGYPKELGGLPEDNPEFYRDRSPLTRVSLVKTPTLVMHGLRDSRVAPSQSRLWVDALRAQGIAVEYKEYPDEDHSLARRRTTIRDMMERMAAFLTQHLARR